ncbi:MAG: RNA methyltransferase [Lachnospiraceae bacterium]|jgi:TrmH family RNA methyltransferase|nr:RNA methyltransferase [Lachnospiraceae bacterium]
MINSTANRQVRRVANLAKKARARREEDLYVAEGIRICRELEPEKTEIIYVTEGFLQEESHKELLKKFRWEQVSDPVMKIMADTQTPQGILALVKQQHYTLDEILNQPQTANLILLETIQDPGNLGTILRAGEGAGITGVIMDESTADLYNPKVIRSAMGSASRVPFVYVDSLKEACMQIKERGIRLFAAYLKGSRPYDMEKFTEPCGFMIGNEAKGLTKETLSLADVRIHIPMEGQVESLNAAMAASVLMFEAARQRRRMGT